MGRELRRKQAKKDGKSLKSEELEVKNPIKKLIIITVSIVIFGGLIYLMSALFVTKELDWFQKKEDTSSKIDTSIILASQVFKQKEEEYYVYFYDFNEEDKEITDLVNNKITGSLYKVDSSSSLNSNYISEESNKKAKTVSRRAIFAAARAYICRRES